MRAVLFLAVMTILAPVGAAKKVPGPELVQIRLGGDMNATRLVFDLSGDTEFTVAAEEKSGAEQVTRRLVVTMPALAVPKAVPRMGAPGRGLIRAWQRDPADPRRFILELTEPVGLARRFTLAPAGPQKHWRAVVDLVPSDAAAFRLLARRSKADLPAINASVQKPRIARAPVESEHVRLVRASVSDAPIVVLDAGHGGKDPGTVGVSGAKEKEVVLRTALELHDILRARGYDVRMTRDNDAFLSLAERVAFARAQGADLFISIHADSASRTSARGASVYTLSEMGGERARNVKLAQDWVQDFSAPERPREVAGILLDLTQRDTKNRSAQFAGLLLEELTNVGPILANSHRNAGFFVLLAPDVPAVLLEMGFLSNAEDETRLMSANGRKKIALATAEAVDRFFANAPRDRRLASRETLLPAP